MATTLILPNAIAAAAESGASGQPIFMLSLLRYNERAEYNDGSTLPACSGREAYFGRYVPAFGALSEGSVITPFRISNVVAGIIVPADEQWDDVAIMEYPNFPAFRALVESDAYKAKAAPHRVAALADWRLIASSKADLPG
jgi:hypothetical protein